MVVSYNVLLLYLACQVASSGATGWRAIPVASPMAMVRQRGAPTAMTVCDWWPRLYTTSPKRSARSGARRQRRPPGSPPLSKAGGRTMDCILSPCCRPSEAHDDIRAVEPTIVMMLSLSLALSGQSG